MRPFILLALTLPLAHGQHDPIVQLPAVVVSSATGEMRAASVFGDTATYLDTPRAFSQVSQVTLDNYAVTKIGQLPSFTSSVQLVGTYGHTATVNVRGDMAELYQNGQ